MEALAKRSTARAFATNELSSQQISSLPLGGFGINGPTANRTRAFRQQSSGNRHICLLKSGACVYSAASNRLDLGGRRRHPRAGGTRRS